MLYIYGASGHAKVILDIADMQGFVVGGFIDVNPAITQFRGYSVWQDLPANLTDYNGNTFILAIGDNSIRQKLATSPSLQNQFFETLVHAQASVSPSAELGQGTVVMAGAVVNADTQVGAHCIINTNSSVDHDCVLEDFVHISPGAAIAGGVQIGQGTHIGIGACVIPGIKIGKECTIGAGAVIIRDIPDGATVVGNPGRIISSL